MYTFLSVSVKVSLKLSSADGIGSGMPLLTWYTVSVRVGIAVEIGHQVSALSLYTVSVA